MDRTKLFLTLSVVLLICLSSGLCIGQKLLFHHSRFREVTYSIGDEITFQVKGSKVRTTARIVALADTLIQFDGFGVNPRSISHMIVDKKSRRWYFMKYKWSRLMMYTGAGFLALQAINEGEVDKETAIWTTSLFASGVAVKYIIGDRIKIKGRRKLVVLN